MPVCLHNTRHLYVPVLSAAILGPQFLPYDSLPEEQVSRDVLIGLLILPEEQVSRDLRIGLLILPEEQISRDLWIGLLVDHFDRPCRCPFDCLSRTN